MNFFDKLVNGCEVTNFRLGNFIRLEKGKQLNKDLLNSIGLFPAYNGGSSHSGYTDSFSHEKNKTIISQGGASAGFVNFITTNFYANAHCYVVLPNQELLNNKYAYHFLKKNQKNLSEKKFGAGIPALNSSDILDLEIPIPCPENPKKSLEIQSEIVRILDAFTAHTAELTAELTARKQQYEYYRDKLLSFEEGEVEWKRLGDVVRIKNGKDHKMLNEGSFPVYGSGGVMRYVDQFVYNKPSVLIPRKGSLGNLFFVDFPFWNVDTIFYTEINESLIQPKFLYYFLTTVGLGDMNQAGGVPSQTQSVLNELKIPVPTLNKQCRIVSILDKFETISSSLTKGLPHEIELRQKQYEYYRDLLLSFPKPEAVSAGS